MSKTIIYNDNARAALKRGVDKLANAVKVTLGPKGKAVVFERGTPIFSLDGVTVAREIQLKDQAENMGARLVMDVARKTDKEAGDGTTTATILAQSILSQGIKALSAGIDHTKMKKGMEEALGIAKKTIKDLSIEVSTKQEISDIATISSRDREVGDLIAEIIDNIGKEGVIAVEEGKLVGLYSEIVEGMKLEKGYISPYFITNAERGETVLENPYVLVTSQIISSNQDVMRFLEAVFQSDNRSLFVVADTVKGEALASLVMNKARGIMAIAAVACPGIGDEKREQLKDIAALTGAKFISEEMGQKVEDVDLEDLGQAARIIINKDNTIIIDGKGKKEDIDSRAAQIKKDIELERSEYERERKEERLARLKGGVAVIKVGSVSEAENMERRYRIEDAVKAAKSSLDEGIVPGGGMALVECSKAVQERLSSETDLSFRVGMEIIAESIIDPARQILLNAGHKPDVVLSKCEGQGFNSATGEYVDLIKAGVIDPAKVVRCALENAVSVVSMFLIAEAVIINEVEKEKKND